MKIAENIDLSSYLGLNNREYFLTMEGIAMEILADEISADSVIPDYTLLSIPHVLKWMLGRVEILSKIKHNVEDTEYISHINGQIDDLVLHAAYYLGESYIRSAHSLSWETDKECSNKRETMFPCVTGFKYGFKMYPVDEINNIRSNISSKNPRSMERCIDEVILHWLMKIN